MTEVDWEWMRLPGFEGGWLRLNEVDFSLLRWKYVGKGLYKFIEIDQINLALYEVCQEWGVKNGGTWRMFRVPDWRLAGQGHPRCHWWPCLTIRKIP